MKTIKKLMALLLSVSMAFPFAACQNPEKGLTVSTSKTPTITTAETYTLKVDYPYSFDFSAVPTEATAANASIEATDSTKKEFLITPINDGLYVIELKNGAEVLDTVTVTITKAAAAGLEVLTEKNPSISTSQTYTLKVDYPDGYAFSYAVTESSKSIATVSKIGTTNKEFRVTPKKRGTCIINLYENTTIVETITVTVYSPPVNTLTVLSNKDSLVSIEDTYLLEVDFPQGYDFSAGIDSAMSQGIATISAVEGSNKKDWLVTPLGIGRCRINLYNGATIVEYVDVFFAENGVWQLVVETAKAPVITKDQSYTLKVKYPSTYNFRAVITSETTHIATLSTVSATDTAGEFLVTPKWVGICQVKLYNDAELLETINVTINLPTVTSYVMLTDKEAEISDTDKFSILINYPATFVNVTAAPSSATASMVSVAIVGSSKKEFIVTPKTVGVAKIEIKNGATLLDTVTLTIVGPYPGNPNFNAMSRTNGPVASWTENTTHDPSMIEVDGKYYVFSTDISGQPVGYQIRSSTDLIHWQYENTAILAADLVAGSDFETQIKGWNTTMTGWGFWAPDIVKGADGKFWLYWCHTDAFGSSNSILGLAKADNILGPYKYDSIIVKSAANAGSSRPNAIDPQIIYEENDPSKAMYMAYGSFSGGIYMLKLNRETGRRLHDIPYSTSHTGDIDTGYYGKKISGSSGNSMEGPVITYQPQVKEWNESLQEYETKAYYYLFASYYDLTSTYHMRSARSEHITGPYVDIKGNTLSAPGANSSSNTGNKVMDSFKWENDPFDYSAPGHNDLFTTSKGVNLVVYHCRTWKFDDDTPGSGNNYHYLYLSQFATNALGQLVINPNRYAGERLRKIEEDEITSSSLSSGAYMLVTFTNNSSAKVNSVNVVLNANGTIAGAKTGTWLLYGDNYIRLIIDGEIFEGVVMPAWIKGSNKAGLNISALSTTTGMAMYLNSRF